MRKPGWAVVLGAAAAVAAFSAAREARADLTFPTGFSSVFTTGGGSISTGGGPTDANLHDGNYISVSTNGASVANQRFFMVVNLPATTGGNTDLILWVGPRADGSVQLTQIVWFDTGGRTATLYPGTTLTAAAPGDIFRRNDIAGAGNLTTYTVVSGFVPTLINRIDLYFQFSNAAGQGGLQLDIDAVSNPEPGTLALFALGGLAFAAAARRRRRARTAAR